MNPRGNSLVGDRYLPLRKATANDHLSAASHADPPRPDKQQTPYVSLMEEQHRRCLSFSKQKTESTAGCSSMETAYSTQEMRLLKEKQLNLNLVRKMEAYQIIHAPGVADNYYGQRLDWSNRGSIGVGIMGDCFLYSNRTISKVSFGSRYLSNYGLTSLKFSRDGSLLYLGDSNGEFNVIDLNKLIEVRALAPHTARIGCIESTFDWGVLTGSKDCSVAHHDIRLPKSVIMKLVAHKHEVCGMAFQNGMVASGSNDGAVLIWSVHNSQQFNRHRLHSGAVKALQWCPWRANLLATGGGSNDHKTILWNSQAEEVEQVLEGKSQVTGLAWRQSSRDLVTTHGGNRRESYGMIWSSKIKEFTHILTGHTKRIVGLAISPSDQSEICTLGADETMRFWKTKREEVQEGREGKDSHLSGASLK